MVYSDLLERMRQFDRFLTVYIWVSSLGSSLCRISLEPAESANEAAIVLQNGRPDMRAFYHSLETLDESDTYSESPPPVEDPTATDENGVDSEGPYKRGKRYVFDTEKRRWTYGIIPFTFDESLDETRRLKIQKVFSLIEYWTHFRFLSWNESLPDLYQLDHRNYLIFIRDRTCWSYVGNHKYQKGQKISCCAGVSCLHEIGHAIGFHHEHCNPLRDQYIRVNYDNIVEKMIPFFNTKERDTDRGFGYFDMSSVMAYPSWAYSKNKRDVITVYDKELEYLIHQKDSTGFYLFYEAQTMYEMTEQMCPNMTLSCQNGGYMSYINGTCRCRCPVGLDYSTGCTTLTHEELEDIQPNNTCGEIIYLSSDNPVTNITTPGFPDFVNGHQNCTWFIKGPKNTTLSLDFHHFEVTRTQSDKCDSHLEIQHVLPGQPGVKYCGRGFQKTVVSEVNMVSVILQSKQSAKFSATVQVLEDLCYTNGGKDNSYGGTVNFTEEFQSCLPWDQVTHCQINTFNVDDMDLEHNYCRNPGYGTRPWCYVDADTCERGYCDVCHLRKCYDLFDDCEVLLLSDKDYCKKGLDASRGCRKTCGLCDSVEKRWFATHCDAPPVLQDSTTAMDNSTKFNVGDVVTYTCLTNTTIRANITCTSEGTWTYIQYVCQDRSICADQRTDCTHLLERNPAICLHRPKFAAKKCAKTCALCNWSSAKVCRDRSPSFNTMFLSPRYAKQGRFILKMCYFGYKLSSGSLYRTCKPDGTLTGQPPRCAKRDEITEETYHVALRRRKHTGGKDQAIVINNQFYKIRRSGEINAWKFYSKYPGKVIFQVWSYYPGSKRYILRGENSVNDTKSDRLVQVNIPVSDRIQVYPGQLLGVYYDSSNPGGIPFDDCVTKYDPQGASIVLLKIDKGNPQLNKLYSVKKTFSCRLYSFSAIIGPQTSRPGHNRGWSNLLQYFYSYLQRFRAFPLFG